MALPWKPNQQQAYEKQERRLAKKPNSRPQLNSGRTWSGRGDVKENTASGTMLIDAKDRTESKSYRLTEEEWTDLKLMANKTPPGCNPMLALNLGQHRLIIIEESMWDEIKTLVDRIKENVSAD